MIEFITTIEKTVPTSGTLTLPYSTNGNSVFKLTGSPTLTADVNIESDESLEIKGLRTEVWWNASGTDLDGNDLTILGVTMTEKQLSRNTKFIFEYDGTNFYVVELKNNKDGVLDESEFVIDEDIELRSGIGAIALGTLQSKTGKRLYTAGAITLTASISITATGVKNKEVYFYYEGDIDPDGNTVTILGTLMPDALLDKKVFIRAFYNGTSWVVIFSETYEAAPALADDAVTTAKILDEAVTVAKMADLARGSVLIGNSSDRPSAIKPGTGEFLLGDGTDFNAVGMTGQVVMDNAGATTIAATPFEGIYRNISLETDFLGDVKIAIPFNCTVEKITAHVDKLIEATDDASLNVKDNSGSSMGTITATANSSVGTGFTLSPSSNNTFTAGQIMTISTSKTTPGGEVHLSIQVNRTSFSG